MFRRQVLSGVILTVRVEAVWFFLVLALLLDVLIMPWALDTHPRIRQLGAHGIYTMVRVTQHASLLVTQLGTVTLLLIVIAASLAHEVGHALALRRAGATEIEIVVYGAGGACRAQARDTTPLALTWYAVAGPLVTIAIVIALICGRMVIPWPHTMRALLWLAAAIQAGILTLNLLPVFKRSDGGHILAAMSALAPGNTLLRVATAVCLSGIVIALLGTLQSDIRLALPCCALTVLQSAAVAAMAWRLDARSAIDDGPYRPDTAGKAIAFW